jgi:hypothetical protein
MNDFKQLCRELVWLDQAEPGDYADWRYAWNAAIKRARAALAEPEPKGPTDEALDELFTEIDQSGEPESWRVYARAVLARWGK